MTDVQSLRVLTLPSELSQWDFSDISQLYASTFLWSIAVIMVGSIDVQNALNTHQDHSPHTTCESVCGS